MVVAVVVVDMLCGVAVYFLNEKRQLSLSKQGGDWQCRDEEREKKGCQNNLHSLPLQERHGDGMFLRAQAKHGCGARGAVSGPPVALHSPHCEFPRQSDGRRRAISFFVPVHVSRPFIRPALVSRDAGQWWGLRGRDDRDVEMRPRLKPGSSTLPLSLRPLSMRVCLHEARRRGWSA